MRITAVLYFLLVLTVCASNAGQKKISAAPQAGNADTRLAPCLTFCAPGLLDDISIREETAGFSIDIRYPVLCAPQASRTIRDHVTQSLSDFKNDFPEPDLRDYPYKNEMNVGYEMWSAGKGRLASVKLQVMVFTGGAHPNYWPVTWVFDMTDGHVLDPGDIFLNEQDALIEVARIARQELKKTLGDMSLQDMVDDGTTPVAINFKDFILDKDAMILFFAPYQVAPYAAGQQTVTIPYDRLVSHLTPEIQAILK